MKFRSLLLSLLPFLSPALVQASDYVENGSSAIWSLRQLSDLGGDPLPQDLLNVLGKSLIDLERHAVLIPHEAGKKWVPIEKIVSDLVAFRDSESSKAEIAAVLEIKEQIKEGLLKKLSAQWENGLEDLMKEHTQNEGQLNPGKAYGAAFLTYFTVELNVTRSAARDAVYSAAWNDSGSAAGMAAESAASDAAWNAARDAAKGAAWDAVFNELFNTVHLVTYGATRQKLTVLSLKLASEIGQISYDLAELFALLWLTENAHEYCKMAFDHTYAVFPAMELTEVKAKIAAKLETAAINMPDLKDNMFIKALKRNLDAVEKFVLAK